MKSYMKEETKGWLKYSEDNLKAAKLLLQSELYNPCLHNVQQSIEKSLKSVFIEKDITFLKTHSILELKDILISKGVSINLSDDECEFLDSIYLPTKYPMGSALPYFYPDSDTCKESIAIGRKDI